MLSGKRKLSKLVQVQDENASQTRAAASSTPAVVISYHEPASTEPQHSSPALRPKLLEFARVASDMILNVGKQ